MGGRTTSVRQLAGSALGVDELRARVAAGFADSFGVTTELGALGDDEVQEVERLARERYETQAWVFQRPGVPRTDGQAELRTPGGGIEARVALSGRTLQAVHFGGDLFAEEGALADLEGRLRWHATEGHALAATVGAWARAGAASSVGADDVLAVLLSAIERASAQPYGCFLSPGGGA